MIAAAKGYEKTVKKLMKLGASLNPLQVDSSSNKKDNRSSRVTAQTNNNQEQKRSQEPNTSAGS